MHAGQWRKVVRSGENPTISPVTGQPTATPRETSGSGPGPVFTGEYRHAVDGKGRLAVPARFRAQLDGGAVVARWLDTCLAIFPMPAWEELATKVGSLPMTDPNARTCSSASCSPEPSRPSSDRSGPGARPAGLRTFAGLEGEAVVVGSRDHAEIWAPARWATTAGRWRTPTRLAQAIAGLGI